MSLVNISNPPRNRGKHPFEIPIGSSGEFVVSVSPGRNIQINVSNPAGDAFDHIYYNFSEKEATDSGVARVKGVIQASIVDTNYNAGSIVGMQEVGIELGAPSTGAIIVEIVECKL